MMQMTTFAPSTTNATVNSSGQLNLRSAFASPWVVPSGPACSRTPCHAIGSVPDGRASHQKRRLVATQASSASSLAPTTPAAPLETAIASRAVVIGSGLAGLAASRVLADLFDEVLLLERDSLQPTQDGGIKRAGVPQFQQPHVLLVGGLNLFEELCQGFKATLEESGAQPVDWLKEARVYDFGKIMEPMEKEGPSVLDSVGATRSLFENAARKVVTAQCANITPQYGAAVTALKVEGGSVAGVVLKDGKEIPANLVVDCSGRNSSMPKWLEAAGFSAPPQTVVDSGLGYGSRTYKMPDGWFHNHGWKAMVVGQRPSATRTGMLLPVEHDSWQVILTGLKGDHPPKEEEGFLGFAQSLSTPDIYNAISQAQPLGPISQYARTENLRRRYDKVDLPDGLCILGDACASFNPTYGQGMTVGIKGAVLMRDILRRRLGNAKFGAAKGPAALQGFTQEFQAQLAQLQEFPWTVAAGADETNMRLVGKLPPKKSTPAESFLKWYFTNAVRASFSDPEVLTELSKVNHMMAPPTAIFSGLIVSRVIALKVKDAWRTLLAAVRPARDSRPSSTSAAKA